MNCPNHRMVMISSEAIYKKFDYEQRTPERMVYTYQCKGECKQKIELQTKTTK